jgi:hypothetical protein
VLLAVVAESTLGGPLGFGKIKNALLPTVFTVAARQAIIFSSDQKKNISLFRSRQVSENKVHTYDFFIKEWACLWA